MTADVFLTSAFGPASSVDLAKVAERAGFGGVWLAEHHFIQYGRCPSATVLAGHLLAATGLRVGTAACVMSARNPIALAEETALLQALAPGRFRLGVARGGPWIENDLIGGGMERYHHGFQPWLDELLAYFRGQGRAPIVPPLASPPSIHVAATSIATVEVAAKRGLPLLLGVEHDNTSAQRMMDHWTQVAGGHSGEHVRVMLAYPRGSRAEAELRERLPRWLARIGDPTRDLAAHVEHLIGTQAIGTPLQVAQTLAASPVPHTLLMVEAAGSFEETADLIEELAYLVPFPTDSVHTGTHVLEC